ncbi:unnamed protein product, partial [Meganyctiphanes norvegica]
STFVTSSTLHHVLSPEDNRQELGCVVSHHLLAHPEITTAPITVIFRGVVTPQQVTGNVGDLQKVECRVKAAQSAVNITWILNGTDITSQVQAEIKVDNINGSFVTSSTLNHVWRPEDNGQILGCVVSHHTLAEPEITSVPITVFFAPIEQKVQTYKYITLQSDYEIRLNFSSYPQPNTTDWSYQTNFMEMPNLIQNSNDNSKFSTSLK